MRTAYSGHIMKQLVLTLLAATTALAAVPAMAAPVLGDGPVAVRAALGDAEAPRVRYAQARQISPAEAKRIALRQVRGGEVVDIRRSGDNYRVRVIARDGRVVDIVVDARTGRVR